MIVRCRISRRWRSAPRWISHILIATGMSLLSLVVWSETESALYQIVQERQFDAKVESASIAPARFIPPPQGIAPMPPAATLPRRWSLIADLGALDPLLVGRLEIPRLGLSAMVREGVDESTLRKAIGHVPGTALPGQFGNFVIVGHRDSFFRGLRSIQNNDEVRVRTHGGVFIYHVSGLRVVEPADTRDVAQTATPVCTLVTCFPFDYIGPAPRRFIVRAELK